MPTFDYRVLNEAGKRERGTIIASDRQQAIAELRDRGFQPLTVNRSRAALKGDFLDPFKPVKLETLVYFFRQLAAMADSSVPTLQALATLRDQQSSAKFRDIIGNIVDDVNQGVPLWKAFSKHPTTFKALHCAMIHAGEESGSLAKTLKELAETMERQLRLKRAVQSASAYPKVVFVFAFLIISLLLMTLVPDFAHLFVTTVQHTASPGKNGKLPDASLPGPTQVVWKLSQLLYPSGPKNGGWFLQVAARFGGAFALIYAVRRLIAYILRQPGPRAQWDAFKLRAPLRIGPLVQKLVVARFARSFASLLSAGIPAYDAMEIVADTSGNAAVADAVMHARTRMLQGATIAQPLASSAVFPLMVTRMVSVGEDTGQLELMLSKVAEFFEDEVEMAMKSLTSIIEPLMVLLVGASVGFIIIAIYLPMFKLYDLIGTGASGSGMLLAPYALNYLRGRWAQLKRFRALTDPR